MITQFRPGRRASSIARIQKIYGQGVYSLVERHKKVGIGAYKMPQEVYIEVLSKIAKAVKDGGLDRNSTRISFIPLGGRYFRLFDKL